MLSWKIGATDRKHALVGFFFFFSLLLLEHKEAINMVWNAVKPLEPNTGPEITSRDEIIKSDS